MDTKERDIFIREKLNEGMSLSDVQHALAEEFGIRMTYLDLRMLAATLPVEWENQDRTKAQPAKDETSAEQEQSTEDESMQQDATAALTENGDDGQDPAAESDGAEDGEVPDTVVTLDEEPMPGAAMSGTVRFMSGISCGWFMDRMGRLGFNLPEDAEEQPSEDDIQAFQVELQRIFQERAAKLRQEAFDGTTKVDISPIQRPGCDLNGTVEFSSGAKGEWFVMQGKLDFELAEESSKPTREDMEKFRMVLAETMRSKGYR